MKKSNLPYKQFNDIELLSVSERFINILETVTFFKFNNEGCYK